ncbi:MAG: hypothetical protein JXX14_16925 [Deltaproteobacteria bacterium]|nr:hypothetical protein [Deltaproteobacteria bacterium]
MKILFFVHNMKGFITAVVALLIAILAAGCGNDGPKATAQSERTPAETSTKTVTSAGTQKRRHATRTINANGNTSDGQPTSLALTVDQNRITGNLIVDGSPLQLSGMMDGQTVRCWIEGDNRDGFRGNLIGLESNNTLRAEFTVSNNAGEKVIKGTLTN